MSFEQDLVDALLAHVMAAIPTVTEWNAIREGFKPEHDVGIDLYPFVEGFGVTVEASAGDEGQDERLYTVNTFLVDGVNQAEALWTAIGALRVSLFADYHLSGTVNRVWMSEYGVEESGDSDRERTLAVIIFQVEVTV